MKKRPAGRKKKTAIIILALAMTGIGAGIYYIFDVPQLIPNLVNQYVEERKHDSNPLVVKRVGVWEPVDDGLDVRQTIFDREGRWFSRFRMLVLRVDARKKDLRVVYIQPNDPPQTDIQAVAREVGAVALMNASYFEPDFKVMGLVVSGGRTFNRLRREGNIHHGVWLIKGNEVFLLHRSNVSLSGIRQAFQAGPWLVTDGEAQTRFRNADQVTRRSAIGVDRKGRVLMIATDALLGGLSLPELADMLARPEEDGGLNVWRAFNCDGGTSTQMLLRHDNLSLTIHSGVHVPVYLGVFDKG